MHTGIDKPGSSALFIHKKCYQRVKGRISDLGWQKYQQIYECSVVRGPETISKY